MKFLWIVIQTIGVVVSISLLFSGYLGGFLVTLISTAVLLAIIVKTEEYEQKKRIKAPTGKTRPIQKR